MKISFNNVLIFKPFEHQLKSITDKERQEIDFFFKVLFKLITFCEFLRDCSA